MRTEQESWFSIRYREVLELILARYGYKYNATDFRPRESAVEFTNSEYSLFVGCDGDALFVDLILSVSAYQSTRVSLYQALWYNGVKTLVGWDSCEAQLEAFARKVDAVGCCKQLLGVSAAAA